MSISKSLDTSGLKVDKSSIREEATSGGADVQTSHKMNLDSQSKPGREGQCISTECTVGTS